MTIPLSPDQFNHTQINLIYCALDSPHYQTLLLIEREVPGRATPPPKLQQADLYELERGGWVSILSQQIDIEPSFASQVEQQVLLDAIDDPERAKLIQSAQPPPKKVLIARIQYRLTDKGILNLVSIKPEIKARFDLSYDEKLSQPPGPNAPRIYVISTAAIGHFSIKREL